MTKSETAKARWQVCEIVAINLTRVAGRQVTKSDVYNYLYKDLKSSKLLERATQGVDDVLKAVMLLPAWERMLNKRKRKCL